MFTVASFGSILFNAVTSFHSNKVRLSQKALLNYVVIVQRHGTPLAEYIM